MENEIFAALAQYGFQPINQNVCVGTWNNYAVCLRKYSGKTYYAYFALRLGNAARSMRKPLKRAIKELGARHDGKLVQVMPNWVLFSFCFRGDENPAARFSDRMSAYTNALRSVGAPPANTCAISGAANPDSLCYMEDQRYRGYQPVFASAVQRSGYETQMQTEENDLNGSYLTGFLGALLGTVAGVALNVAVMVFFKRIYVMLFALVPIAAMYGYKRLRGKTDKVAAGIVCALSIASVPVMEFLRIAVSYAKEEHVPLDWAMKVLSKVFFEAEILEKTVPHMLEFLVFMGLGLLIGWNYVKNSLNGNKIQSAKLRMESLRKNPNV